MSEDKEGYYIGTAKVINSHHSGKASNVERTAGDESIRSRKGAAFNSRVSIKIYHYRCRLADPGGISDKAAIDGLVNCGILRDDSTKEIEEIRHWQIKVNSTAEEKTIIEIEEVD